MPSEALNPQVNPDELESVSSLMAALLNYDENGEVYRVLREYEEENARITELRKALGKAKSRLAERLRRVATSVLSQVSFERLKGVLQIDDVLERRAAMIALLEDFGIDYHRISK